MRKIKNILWGLLAITNAIGIASMGAIGSMFFFGEAIGWFREFRNN